LDRRGTPADHPEYRAAQEQARLLVKAGYSSDYRRWTGIMEAANRGAFEAGGTSVGFNIELASRTVFESISDAVIEVQILLCAQDDVRKITATPSSFFPAVWNARRLFEALTLIQTRKIHNFPVVLFGSAYWKEMLDWLRGPMLAEGKIVEEDFRRLHVTDSPAEIVETRENYEPPKNSSSHLDNLPTRRRWERNYFGCLVTVNGAHADSERPRTSLSSSSPIISTSRARSTSPFHR